MGAQFCRKSALANYIRLDLCKEYTYRFDKIHKTQAVLEDQWKIFQDQVYGYGKLFEEMTPFQNSARNSMFDFSHLPVVEAYQTYLVEKWKVDKRKPKWTRRGPPKWAEPHFTNEGVS